MVRRTITAILMIPALATLATYASSRITGQEWDILEVGELWCWHADRTSLGCELNSRYFYVWYNDPKPRPGSTWGRGMATYRFMGVRYVVHANSWGYRMVHGRVSLWVPAVLFGAYPAAVGARKLVRRWRRPPEGHCQTCGYNLTGNVSGVCPECGETV